MTDSMKQFMELVSSDEALRTAVEASGKLAGDAVIDSIIGLADAHGVTLTREDFASDAMGEICDDELEAVVGGGTCYCLAGGGGTKDQDLNHKPCGCVLVGVDKYMDGGNRCLCVGGGAGSQP